MNFPVNMEDICLYFSVPMHMCPDVKAIKIVYTFCTRVCNSILNYVNHVKQQPHQEVKMIFFIIHSDVCDPLVTELMEISENTTT